MPSPKVPQGSRTRMPPGPGQDPPRIFACRPNNSPGNMHDFYKASPKQSPENAHRTLQTSKAVSRELAKTPCVKLHASPRVPQRVAPEMISGFDQAHPSILQISMRTPQEICRDLQVICMGFPPRTLHLASRSCPQVSCKSPPELPNQSAKIPQVICVSPPSDSLRLSLRNATRIWPRCP